MKQETRAVTVGEEPDYTNCGDVVMPVHLASTYARQKVGVPTGGHEYSRTDNPTRQAMERKMAALENAGYALAYASGLAAETSLILSLIKTGDHIVAFNDLYGGTRRLFLEVFTRNYGVEFSFVDATDPGNMDKAIRPDTAMIWLETPTNPLLKLCDIRAISKIARAEECLLVVDNTFMSPFFQTPLDLGADISLHSTTKYINGHCDSVGGCIMLSDRGIYEKLKFVQNAAGAVLSPFESYLVMRGAKTLPLRMRAHEANAMKLAAYLDHRPEVRVVHYPGLATHPQHSLARRQMSGFGGMISFELDTDLERSMGFVERMKLFKIAESLGGVESLIEFPAVMTHASIPPEKRREIGLSDSLIRISVGVESPDDLIGDFEQAFDRL
ncbi:MAG: PLP-dependent aspartate aminotransferase family protein [Desulfobacterales bacterium]|nr:PLP-dependent aspartate aminotransferase family protein [Desulfobacterales bacterium]